MTVSTTTSKVSYAGNGSTVAFAVNFYFLANADIKVVLRAANGTETVKTLNTDYTVTGAGVSSGGTVTMVTAPASGQTLVIARNAPLTQLVDYQPNDPFPATTHEQALDKLTMIVQQQQEQLDRSAKLPISSTADANTLSAAILQMANDQANIDAVAADLVNIDAVAAIDSEVVTVAGIASNVTTVAGISSSVSAVAAIDSDVTTVASNIAAVVDAPNQASAAASSAAAAASSAAAAALSYDSFDDRYLGAKTSAPSVDNDGNALVSGAMYFNTGAVVADNKGMWIYDGSTWLKSSSNAQAALINYRFVATAGQTVFTGADANGLTLAYTANSIIVAVSGVVQSPDTYTATNGTSVTLSSGVSVGVVVNIYAFNAFDVANTYTQAQTDAFLAGKLSSAAGAVTRTNAANDLLGVTQNAQSSNYTLALTDIGKHVYSTNSGAQTVTIPTNASVAFPVGAAITLVNNGTTNITISTTSITLYQAGTSNTGNRTLATKGVATLLKVATDTWFVSGAGLS